MTAASGPLAGIRVLDLTRYIAGPLCGQMLADAGAEVIKIEPPKGEVSRHEPPQVRIADDLTTGLLFLRFNRGKKSVVVDTRTEAGREEFRRLVESADVLVENFRPGMLDSWGFGWDALHEINPRLIYATITGFGYENSPLRDFPVFSTIAEAMSGLISKAPEGDEEPVGFGLPVADGVSGLYAVIGILQAVLERNRTGAGTRVDIAMYDSALVFNDLIVANASVTNSRGEQLPEVLVAPSGYFQASDGWLAIGVGTDKHWRALCEVAGWTDWLEDGRYDDRTVRGAANTEHILPRLDEWLRQRTAWEAARALAERGIPAGPLQDGDDILSDEQARARGILRAYESLDGTITLADGLFGVHGAATGGDSDFARIGQHDADYLDTEIGADAGAESATDTKGTATDDR